MHSGFSSRCYPDYLIADLQAADETEHMTIYQARNPVVPGLPEPESPGPRPPGPEEPGPQPPRPDIPPIGPEEPRLPPPDPDPEPIPPPQLDNPSWSA